MASIHVKFFPKVTKRSLHCSRQHMKLRGRSSSFDKFSLSLLCRCRYYSQVFSKHRRSRPKKISNYLSDVIHAKRIDLNGN